MRQMEHRRSRPTPPTQDRESPATSTSRGVVSRAPPVRFPIHPKTKLVRIPPSPPTQATFVPPIPCFSINTDSVAGGAGRKTGQLDPRDWWRPGPIRRRTRHRQDITPVGFFRHSHQHPASRQHSVERVTTTRWTRLPGFRRLYPGTAPSRQRPLCCQCPCRRFDLCEARLRGFWEAARLPDQGGCCQCSDDSRGELAACRVQKGALLVASSAQDGVAEFPEQGGRHQG